MVALPKGWYPISRGEVCCSSCGPEYTLLFLSLAALFRCSFIMPFSSPFPDLEIPKCNLLEYLFPKGEKVEETPIWIDAKDTGHHLTPRALLQWSKRLALGLDRLGSKPQEVVMIYTPNQIFVPVAYLGIVGSKRIFSGANPAYTVSGMHF